MRLPRVRFTVRRLMVVVAVVAVILVATRWSLRLKVYRSKAVEFARVAEANQFYSRDFAPYDGQSPGDARKYEWYKLSEFYNATLMKKYERAAHAPWLPVEPDPPAPRREDFGIKSKRSLGLQPSLRVK